MDELISSKRKKIIVLFTDGHENASLPYFLKRNTNITQIAKKMRRFNTHMYIISYGNGVNKDLLNGLASITNGKHYNINYAWQIDKVLKEIQHIIRNHYEISYRPYFKEISRTIELAYDNHNNETNVVKKDFVIKKDIDLSVHECDKKSYWYDTTFAKNNKTPIAPPQIAINFDYDRYMLKAEYEKNLNKYITYLKINNDAYVKLIGHTDMTGYEQYNRVLSQQRAESVKNYLVNKGIKSNRIFAEGQGAENPIWNPEDAYFKAYENRRVEIVIYK